MDKLYLKVAIPIDMWRQDDQLETFLFEELACEENLHETKELLSAIDKAAKEMQIFSAKQSEDIYAEAEKLCRANDFNCFWEFCHKIITCAPIEIPELRKILLLRAKIFYEHSSIENAIRDYEICVYVGQLQNSLYLEELVHLSQCLYEVGEYEKFEYYCNWFRKEYNKELKVARSKRNLKKNSSRLASIKQYEQEIRKFEDMQKTLKNKLHFKDLGFVNDDRKFKPYLGFKGSLDERISSASVACTLISKEKSKNRREKVLANRPIPVGEIIAFERPLERDFYTPMLQCEYCYELTTILYTCVNCHQKYYCRVSCLRNDIPLHQYECGGLYNGLLYSLEAKTLFSLFIKCLQYIKNFIFRKYRKAADINDFFELIMDDIKNGPQAKIKKLITNFDNYETVDVSEIYSMATYALRIAVYAVERTTILEDFFFDVEFEKHEILIFVASLLLRLQNQIKINSIELAYIIVHPENQSHFIGKPFQSEIFKDAFSREHNSQSIFEYCNYPKEEASYEAKQLILTYIDETKCKQTNESESNRYKELRLPTVPIKVSRKFMNQSYLDNVGTAQHEFTLEQKLNIAFCSTKEILHLRKHTFNTNLSDCTSAVTMQGIYPTITRFKHSCDPNAVPIFLESGSLVIKAGKNIEVGEEITVSYMIEYKYHSNPVRKQFLSYLKLSCNCKYCTKDNDFWVEKNAIKCYKCNKIILGSKCESCNADKMKLSALYEEICKSVRNTAVRTVEEQNEVRTLKYLILLLQVHNLMYCESHTCVFLSKLEFAMTCVQKNFVYDSYILLKTFFNQMPSVLTKWNYQNLAYLSIVLEKLICLLNANICHNKSYVCSNFELFYEIWNLANEVAKKLMYQHDFFEMFNFKTHNILTQYQQLIQLKFALFDFQFELLKTSTKDEYADSEMPGLEPERNPNLENSVENPECSSDEKYEQISFNVNREDLKSLSISSKDDEGDNYSVNKNCSFTFITADITGNDDVIEDYELKTIIKMSLKNKNGEDEEMGQKMSAKKNIVMSEADNSDEK